MNKKNIIIYSVVTLLLMGATFYGGMQFQKTQRATFAGRAGAGGQAGGFQRGGGAGNAQNVRPVSGEVISQDNDSVTVKLQDGSTKIVILSGDTVINKSSKVDKSELKTGDTISAFGKANSDGSITAQNVSIGGMLFRGAPGGSSKDTVSTSPTP